MIQPVGYRQSSRRILIDTQIPDWDRGFLAHYDVRAAIDACIDAGADALMVYFQSHTGLCNWPVRLGSQHRAFRGHDPVAETLSHAARHGLPVCAYYSVNFNNQAWLEHPDWRLQPAGEGMIGGGLLVRQRYGICCLNAPGYRRFIENQVGEMLSAYAIDAVFFDMVWWMGVCRCEHCRERLRREESMEIPDTIDWLDPGWCRFQAARERWLTEYAFWLRDTARGLQAGITVYHNFALGMMNWTRGVSFDSAAAHDFLGGDFYGGRDEQLLVSRLMLNLSRSRPVEFMTTVTENLAEHETLQPAGRLEQQTLAASDTGSASLMIASIDPDGRLNPGAFERISAAFAARAPLDGDIGGNPVEQIGVWFSDCSKMSFAENGLPIEAAQQRPPTDYPHFSALRGACRKLQRAHLPFGVITREQLGDLRRYAVIVLPDVLRMSTEEAEALRAYVQEGGCLYASRYTSLTDTEGRRNGDFMLADLFGVHFDAVEPGRMVYLQPRDSLCREAIAPQRLLCQAIDSGDDTGLMRLQPTEPSEKLSILATLNLPFGHPAHGSIEGRDWSSIHSSPPWTDTSLPALVCNRAGKGRVIYSAADIETRDSEVNEKLFIALLRELLNEPPAFEVETHPAVWVSMFDQPERERRIISLLHYAEELPALPVTARLRLAPPPGCRYTRLLQLPDGLELNARVGESGSLEAATEPFDLHILLAAEYEARDD